MTQDPNPIRLALVQCDLVDNDIRANQTHIERELGAIAHGEVDLVVLPEVFTTGFTRDFADYADAWQDGAVRRWLVELSTQYGVGIAGSYIVSDGGRLYNRFFLIDGREVQYQDKRHLFALGGEPECITPSAERRLLHFRSWRIMPLVCYDLRFPVWSRCIDCDYDMIVCVASWPEGRRSVWETLLRARAMENLAYVVGVNRVGSDSVGLSYSGDSAVITPRGATLVSTAPGVGETLRATIEYAPLRELRAKFPVWRDADRFTLHTEG